MESMSRPPFQVLLHTFKEDDIFLLERVILDVIGVNSCLLMTKYWTVPEALELSSQFVLSDTCYEPCKTVTFKNYADPVVRSDR